jgi:hypothetical protein
MADLMMEALNLSYLFSVLPYSTLPAFSQQIRGLLRLTCRNRGRSSKEGVGRNTVSTEGAPDRDNDANGGDSLEPTT